MTSRPTICLINFVLSGKPVLLEQYRKGSVKVISHVLTSHAGINTRHPHHPPHPHTRHTGTIFLHCIPGTRSHIDEPPSISEGRGGRITDYRISVRLFACMQRIKVYDVMGKPPATPPLPCVLQDFSEVVSDNLLSPIPVDRTKIPTVYPLQLGMFRRPPPLPPPLRPTLPPLPPPSPLSLSFNPHTGVVFLQLTRSSRERQDTGL